MHGETVKFTKIRSFMKIRPVGAELFLADSNKGATVA